METQTRTRVYLSSGTTRDTRTHHSEPDASENDRASFSAQNEWELEKRGSGLKTPFFRQNSQSA